MRRAAAVVTALAAGGLLALPPSVRAADGTCEGLVPTIVGTDAGDEIIGTDAADVIVTLGGRDTVRGGAGDDVICSGPGEDYVLTGPGSDTLVAGGGDDRMKSQSGADRIEGGTGDDLLELRSEPMAVLALRGGPGDNLLLLRVVDRDGAVAVVADQTARTLSVGGEPGPFSGWDLAWLRGGHAWTYVGTDEVDSVIATEGNVTGYLQGANDVLSAGPGDDFVDGGAGRRDVAEIDEDPDSCVRVEYGDCGSIGPVPPARWLIARAREAFRAGEVARFYR